MTVASPAMRELELEGDGMDGSHGRRSRIPSWTAARSRCIAACPTPARSAPAGAGWSAAMDRLLPSAPPRWSSRARRYRRWAPRPARAGLRAKGWSGGAGWRARPDGLGLDLFEGDRRATAWLAGSAQHLGLPRTAAAAARSGSCCSCSATATAGRFRAAASSRSPTPWCARAAARARDPLRRLRRAVARSRRAGRRSAA